MDRMNLQGLIEEFLEENSTVGLITFERESTPQRMAAVCYVLMTSKAVSDTLDDDDKEGRENIWHNVSRSLIALGVTVEEIDFALTVGIPVMMSVGGDEYHWTPGDDE
jgi:hypothetical protein